MFKKTRKKIAFLCATALLVVTMCIPAFAATPARVFPYVTFDDSKDFTIVNQGIVTYESNITLKGLDASYQKVDFDEDELQYITWTSDSIRVTLYDKNDPWNFGDNISGTDTIGALIFAQGASYITATYAPTVAGTQSVSSYVVSEFISTSSVSGINVSINGDQSGDISATNQTIPLFSLDTVFDDPNYDDADVMQLSPTALHALLYVLENYHSAQDPAYSNDGYTVNDAGYWDWVRENVTVESSGSYVSRIGADSYGWTFNYGNPPAYVDHAASATGLSSGNTVEFNFASWSY